MSVTYIGTLYILPVQRAFELHLREDGRCLSGTLSVDIEAETLQSCHGQVVYAQVGDKILFSAELYDYAQEYLEAEIAIYGGCYRCGNPCMTVMDTLCWECREEDREEERENEFQEPDNGDNDKEE